MTTQPDFEDFLRLLEAHRVEYMIVGGYAVAFHGFPRFTKDIDVFFSDSAANLARLQEALVAFGFQPNTVPLATLGKPDAVLAIGVEPVRIDLLNRIAGVTFAEARGQAVRGRYGDVEVTFIGKEDLLRNKRATGRHRDLGDVEELL
ncbi:MAG: nucleotidyltransferase [Planctomycetia bacterium]|jgi:predicted nucleotidyltransferase